MTVTARDLALAVRTLRLSGRAVCAHSSLGSFGWVDGGAMAVVASLLDEGCTVMVPTFSAAFSAPPPAGRRPPRNGTDYESYKRVLAGGGRAYSTDTFEINDTMGAIPAEVLRLPQRIRGNHPLSSFAAVGPLAQKLIAGQRALAVMEPLRRLIEMDGVVVVMGVGLTTMTLLHLAEQLAGRNLFRRWANGSDGDIVECEYGGCSGGFTNFERVIAPLAQGTLVGESGWRAFPAADTLEAAAAAVRRQPSITHCPETQCVRCNDAIAGGPIIRES